MKPGTHICPGFDTLAAVLVLVGILILILAPVLVAVLILVGVLVLILILIAVLILIIHFLFLRKNMIAACRSSRMPKYSRFILCFEQEACDQST